MEEDNHEKICIIRGSGGGNDRSHGYETAAAGQEAVLEETREAVTAGMEILEICFPETAVQQRTFSRCCSLPIRGQGLLEAGPVMIF